MHVIARRRSIVTSCHIKRETEKGDGFCSREDDNWGVTSLSILKDRSRFQPLFPLPLILFGK